MSENMNNALLNIVIGTKLNRTDLSRLLCSDILVGTNSLEIHHKNKKYHISDYSVMYPILTYYRERVKSTSPNHLLFPYSRQSISAKFKRMTGKTIREYRK